MQTNATLSQSPHLPNAMTLTILPLIARFRTAFSAPSFANFQFLMLAWLMNPERGWITNCLRAFLHMPDLYPSHDGKLKHFSCFYRLFTRACWELDRLGQLMAAGFEDWLPDTLTVIIDDTLCRRGGPMILGGGVHHDPLETTYRNGKASKGFSFGLNFVLLALWIPVPFVHAKGVAVPVLFRLYRSKKTCPTDRYRKRTELAAGMLAVVRNWWPKRRIEISVDDEYACKTVLGALDDKMRLYGPMRMDAALYQPHRPEYAGMGRPSVWGDRLLSPRQMAEDDSDRWEQQTLWMYGQKVSLQVKVCHARWKSAGSDTVLTIIVTRDPTGVYEDQCFFVTAARADVQQVITGICRRWTLEVTIRDSKQLLHVEQIQNGFIHRTAPAKTHRKERPGPQAPPEADPKASRRTVPFFMLGYGFVVRWYLEHGDPKRDLTWARFIAPWWPDKATISFNDMLQAFRRQMEHEDLWTNPPQQGFDENYLRDLPFERPGQDDVADLAA